MIMGLLKSFKFWAIAGVVTALIGFSTWILNARYDAGYNAAELKWREAQQTAIDDAVAEARENWELAAEAAGDNVRVETEIVERVRIVEREVPRIVERVVPSECRDLGPDIQRLFNDAIAAGDSHERSDPAAATEPTG